MTTIQELLQLTIERNASDLHIIPGYYPTIRFNNDLFPVRTTEMMTPELSEEMLLSIMTAEQKKMFLENKEYDFGYEHANHRFRANYYYVKGSVSAAFRVIPAEIRTTEELGLPIIFQKFAQLKEGFVLVTGPTGEGKSTTLASLINVINTTSSRHIITIEDPIEYLFPVSKSIVSQRELHKDTMTWTQALSSVLREDPDVVYVGEIRDLETMKAALTIAETGHLVFSTLHTSSTPEAVHRIIDIFPPHQQNQVRNQLSAALKVVVFQKLVPDANQQSRVPALEILINTSAVAANIREDKIHMLDNIIETGEEFGMVLFERYLAKLYSQGKISRDVAHSYAIRPNEIKKFIT